MVINMDESQLRTIEQIEQFLNVKEPNLRASAILTPSPATCNKATLIRQRLRLESARSRV